jgi:hypothetical protein
VIVESNGLFGGKPTILLEARNWAIDRKPMSLADILQKAIALDCASPANAPL